MKLAATKKQEISIPASNMLAITMDGCRNTRKVRVTSISTWIGRDSTHWPIAGKFKPEVIQSLMKDARESKRITIYAWGPAKGEMSAYPDTPLYTNGEENVIRLYCDGRIIYDVYKVVHF